MADDVIVTDPNAGAAGDWRTGLTGEYAPLAQDPALKDFKDVGALAKSYVATKALVGQKSAVPGADAKPEEVAAFRKAQGVPDAPEGYQIKVPEVPGLTFDQTAAKPFLAAMHKAGATPAVVQTALDAYAAYTRSVWEQDRAAEKAVGLSLRQEWGVNYDAQLGKIKEAVKWAGGDELVEQMYASRDGVNPIVLKAWAKVASDLFEAGVIRGEPGVSGEDAKTRAATLHADLAKVPVGSQEAIDIINRIAALGPAIR